MIDTYIKSYVVPTSSYIPEIGTRFYIGQLPDTVIYPCAVMYSISRNEIQESEVYTERFQFSCYGDTKSTAIAVADAIKGRLKRFQGSFSTTSTYTVYQSFVENTVYQYDPEILKHVEILDMTIMYK